MVPGGLQAAWLGYGHVVEPVGFLRNTHLGALVHRMVKVSAHLVHGTKSIELPSTSHQAHTRSDMVVHPWG